MATRLPVKNRQDVEQKPNNSFADLYREEEGRVHSAVYTSAEVFEAEIERIFGRTWLYIGHESEVPDTGSFQLRQMGRQPVILVRGASGKVNVFMNRCRHRGSVVAETECGKTPFFKCWWHGWVYDSDGKLVEVSRDDAYPAGFRERIGGLNSPPRVNIYRGFVFASLAPDGIDLADYLGTAAKMIDYLVDASPIGQIKVGPTVSKTKYKGNWKFIGMDGYHPEVVHASVFALFKKKANSGLGSTHRGNVLSDKSSSRTRGMGNGHAMLDYRRQRQDNLHHYLEFLATVDGGPEYIDLIRGAYDKERANEVLAVAGDAHVGIYPNLQVIANHVRILNPIAADETQILMFPVTLGGVPDGINKARLRAHESFYGAASAGSPDDAEVFERAQRGLQATVDPWLDISRGMGREVVDPDGSIVGQATDEVPQREQMNEWARLMRG